MPDTMDTTQIDALLKAATPEAANALQEIADGADSKDAKKAAKRALYLLGQKGIAPSVAPKTELVTAPKSAFQEDARYMISSIDGAGNQMLWFILPDSDGGNPTLISVLVNDEEGVRDFLAARMSRREIEGRIADFTATDGATLADMDGDYVRGLVAQAREINRSQLKPTPAGFLELLPRIGDPQKRYDAPPLDGFPTAEAVLAEESYPRDAAALFAKPIFETWFLDMGEVLPHLAQYMIGMAQKSDDPNETLFLRESLVQNLTETVMAELNRDRYAHRLELSAALLWKNGDETTAKQALFHVQKLRNDYADPSGFAFALVQRTMDAARAMMSSAMRDTKEI